MTTLDKIKKLREALTILQDINDIGVENIRQDAILKLIEKELTVLIAAIEVEESMR